MEAACDSDNEGVESQLCTPREGLQGNTSQYKQVPPNKYFLEDGPTRQQYYQVTSHIYQLNAFTPTDLCNTFQKEKSIPFRIHRVNSVKGLDRYLATRKVIAKIWDLYHILPGREYHWKRSPCISTESDKQDLEYLFQ